jgi:aryl-alcohol dehydrogenase-like predicted oxidoreductase
VEYRRLGLTDRKISRIAFGGWAIGGHGYGPVDDRESIAAISQALDAGINLFDTANVYGFGHSEEILSKALGPRRHDVVIATKVGVHWDDTGRVFKDLNPQRLRQALDGSLRRLNLETIPLYQIHWHDNKTPISSIMEVLLRCQEEGKILHIGCCNFSRELLSEATKIGRVESLQSEHNVLTPLDQETIGFAGKENCSVLSYNVLLRGLLYGKYREIPALGSDDTRSKDKHFQAENFERNLRVVNILSEVGAGYGLSPGQMAISYVLSDPAVTCAIVGAKTAAQVLDNLYSEKISIDQEDIQKIRSCVSRNEPLAI